MKRWSFRLLLLIAATAAVLTGCGGGGGGGSTDLPPDPPPAKPSSVLANIEIRPEMVSPKVAFATGNADGEYIPVTNTVVSLAPAVDVTGRIASVALPNTLTADGVIFYLILYDGEYSLDSLRGVSKAYSGGSYQFCYDKVTKLWTVGTLTEKIYPDATKCTSDQIKIKCKKTTVDLRVELTSDMAKPMVGFAAKGDTGYVLVQNTTRTLSAVSVDGYQTVGTSLVLPLGSTSIGKVFYVISYDGGSSGELTSKNLRGICLKEEGRDYQFSYDQSLGRWLVSDGTNVVYPDAAACTDGQLVVWQKPLTVNTSVELNSSIANPMVAFVTADGEGNYVPVAETIKKLAAVTGADTIRVEITVHLPSKYSAAEKEYQLISFDGGLDGKYLQSNFKGLCRSDDGLSYFFTYGGSTWKASTPFGAVFEDATSCAATQLSIRLE